MKETLFATEIEMVLEFRKTTKMCPAHTGSSSVVDLIAVVCLMRLTTGLQWHCPKHTNVQAQVSRAHKTREFCDVRNQECTLGTVF